MPKCVRTLTVMIMAFLTVTSGAGTFTTASPASNSVAGATNYLYVRLFPAEPWVYQVLDEMAVACKPMDSAIYAALTPIQAANLYSSVSESNFVSFEQIPRVVYEHPELYPQEIYKPLTGVSHITTHAVGPQVTAIVIDNAIYSSLSTRLQTYIVDVTDHFPGVAIQVYHPSSTDLETPEDVRAFLQQVWQTDGVNGAILIGYIPYASWELPWGETASLSLFYEDLDGVFLDQDSDGLYDYRDWGPNEGLEMWISWIRPPTTDPVGYLQAYFDKVHSYYESDRFDFDRALLAITSDWCGPGGDGPLHEAFRQTYGNDWDLLGCGTHGVYLLEYTAQWTSNDYQLQSLWVHSANTVHEFDWDDSQPPGSRLSARQLGALSRGPQMSLIFGCSAMKFTGQPDSKLSTWYIMGSNNGMSALGVSRGIGTPLQEHLVANIHRVNSFAELLFDYLNIVTDRDYILSIHPDELHTFVWDIIFVGNPYLFKGRVHTTYLPLVMRSYTSPGEPRIAFVSERDGDLEIYTMNVNGTGLTQLTDNDARDEGPSWSPDGSRIVFHSDRDGRPQIYVMNADGSNEKRLLASTGWDGWAYWSPDGTRIAFSRWADQSGTGDYRTEVYVMNADGTNVRRLTYSTGATGEYAHGAWPSGWSSDGSQILFYWYREGYDQLWIMNSDGSNQRRLTTDSHWNAIPTMSPDGTQIAFSSYRDGNYEIYVMNADGTGQTRLTYTSGDDWRPTWSEDGSKILFESNRDGRTQVYWMNPDGSQQTRLTDNTAYDGQPTWRPSGQ
jgi:Tol biopolymer transport system component